MINLGNVFCTINRRGGGNEKYSEREKGGFQTHK
jgi:hypothetical protein